MRRSLYFVLMVVLVLRGLTGTAMAAGILPAAGAAHHQAVAAEHGGSHHALPKDDYAHASSACDDSSATGCAAHEHHASTCTACEICHSAMLDAPPAPAQAPIVATGSERPATSARFESALAAPAIKPPIA